MKERPGVRIRRTGGAERTLRSNLPPASSATPSGSQRTSAVAVDQYARRQPRLALLAQSHVRRKPHWLSRCTLEIHPHTFDGGGHFGNGLLGARCFTRHCCEQVEGLILQVNNARLATRDCRIDRELERAVAIVGRQFDECCCNMVLRCLRSVDQYAIASAHHDLLWVGPVAMAHQVLLEIAVGPLAEWPRGHACRFARRMLLSLAGRDDKHEDD